MRRKTSPIALARRSGPPRALRPALMASLLPTAASIAMALGCSTPTLDAIVADPATRSLNTAAPTASAAPSPSPSPYIDPMPYDLEGLAPTVKVPPAPSKKKTFTK
jgi:hypothetical protein